MPLVDAADAGGELCQEGKLDPAKVTGKVVLCLRGGNGRVAKSLAVADAGGVGMILYNTTDVDNLFTDDFIVPTVMLDHSPGLAVKAFIHYVPHARATLSTGGTTTWRSAPSMTIFSSRGPNTTAPDIIKPDITAPGIQVLAGNTPFPPADTSAPGQLFQAIAGTSMSSPVVAGSLALIKQVHPDWSPAAAKSALMTTADTHVVDNDRVTPAGPFAMGAGMVDVGSPSAPGSAFNPGLVYDAGTLDYLGFLCDAAPDFYLLYDVGITCDDLTGIGVPTTSTDLNYPSIGISAAAGTKSVTRIVTSVASKTLTWRSTVDAPAGYSVTVSPRTLTLAPGQSKAYTVTFTNDGSGPIGSFVDGSLTWTAGRYSARSPIEVQGTRLDAPLAISGTGTSGSTTFSEQFGYTGAYTATAHGLVAPTPLDGTVFQDPDQTYPSPDDGAGVVKLKVHLDAAAALRLKLEFAAGDPDDIDLYLLGPDGTEVARSTNAGTDEEIDLTLPADGDYTLVVHGWQITEAAGRPFSVQQWIVPTTPSAGNLTVDAPSAAAIGQQADVTVSWSGLDAGTQYLGAISHADADGIFQLTLVDVAA